MYVTDFGMVIFSNEAQLLKALSDISVTVSGTENYFKYLQRSNIPCGIVVINSGHVNSVIAVLAKA